MRTVAIVDPFSSGQHLGPEFKKRGIAAVAILSAKDLPEFYLRSFRSSDFRSTIEFDGDPRSLAVRLQEEGVELFLAGSEPGVLLSDKLNHCAEVIWNNPATSTARRNKFLMQECLRQQGLPCIRQTRIRSLRDIDGLADLGFELPLVVKPTDSAGTDRVRCVQSADEFKAFVADNLLQRNMLNIPIEELLVQEYLRGTEYVVDVVSCDGTHEVVAVWQYSKRHKNGSSFVYDTMTLVQDWSSAEIELVEYTKKCLDVLGIQNGPSHNEIMLTARGPVLIESGARIHGGNGTIISGHCVGYNQVSRFVDRVESKEKFLATLKQRYSVQNIAQEIFMISSKIGKLRAIEGTAEIKQLPSFHSMNFLVKEGDEIPLTTDLFSSPGRVVLVGTPEQISSDYQVVRKWEREHAFRLA